MTHILILCGPTAIGKSALALELAQKLNGEIISADSQQVWRELDIGTAKPSPADRAKVPHHLIDVASPDEHFDVARYIALAEQAIEDISSRSRLPLIVGGAGLYIDSLLYGLCPAPPQDPKIRQLLMQRMEIDGVARLYEELQKTDPKRAQKIHPNDKTRIIRALEVYQISGKPLAEFHQRTWRKNPRYNFVQIGVTLPREELVKRIDQRLDWMMANGWDEEVRELLKFYPASSQALQSIGYKQLVQYLQGEKSREEAIAEIKKATRAFAKRQMTWFRKNNVAFLEPKAIASLWPKLLISKHGKS